MKIPRAIEKLIESFEKLPGIGPKTAQRLAFYLLHVPQYQLDEFAQSLLLLKKHTVMCSICYNIGDADLCKVCASIDRDKSTVCVVEDPLDVLAIERSGKYRGIYHVLHGVIDPLNNIGPDEIYIQQLLNRITLRPRPVPDGSGLRSGQGEIREIILATNPTLEGEATAMYITKELKTRNSRLRQGFDGQAKLKITRIGRGLPTGADLEYADELTLERALEGRREY